MHPLFLILIISWLFTGVFMATATILASVVNFKITSNISVKDGKKTAFILLAFILLFGGWLSLIFLLWTLKHRIYFTFKKMEE